MKLDVTSNFAEFERALKRVPKSIMIPAAVSSINRAGRDAKRAATKEAVSVTGMRRAVFAGSKRTGDIARISGGTGRAKATRKRLSLVVYARTERGVPFSKAYGKRAIKKVTPLFRSSFLATMPQSGKVSRFLRTGEAKRPTKKGRYAGKKITRGPRKGSAITREPITELLVPIHPYGTRAIEQSFMKKAAEVLPVEFNRVVNRKLAKFGG